MSLESFEYSLLTAGVGMGLVFLFLGALSVLMVVIRTLFDRRRRGGETVPGDSSEETPDPVAAPDWVIAAAPAYLFEEENDVIPNAEGWVRARRTGIE